MKQFLLTIGLAAFLPLALPTTTHAQASDVAFSNIVAFLDASSQAKELTLAIAPSYAPDLMVDGKKAPWGLSVAAMYPVLTAGILTGETGVRMDWLADNLFAPELNVQFQTTMRWFDTVDVTPFVVTGAIFPFGQAGADDTVGAIVGGGIGVRLFTYKSMTVSAGYEVERWTCFPGLIHHVGGALTIRF